MDSNGTQYSHSLGSSMRQCSVRCGIYANSMLSTHQPSPKAGRILISLRFLPLYPDSRKVWLARPHLLRSLCNYCCRQKAKLCHLRE